MNHEADATGTAGDDCAGELTPHTVTHLAQLALLSEAAVELSTALGDATRAMSAALDRHPSLVAPWSRSLQTTTVQLQDHMGKLGQSVMRHSHQFECLVTALTRYDAEHRPHPA